MGDSNGKTTDALIAEFSEKLPGTDFYAFVRLLQKRFPQSPRIGRSLLPAQDPVRFAQSPAMDFASSTLEDFRRKDALHPPVLYSRQFGLFGPHGPLPLALTEYARDRIQHHGDATFASFCNVFHHRMMSFFFRAWAESQKTVDADRKEDQAWPEFIGSLIGLGMESLKARDDVPDRSKLYFAGRLVQKNRNAEGLESIIQEFFGIKTELCSFIGRWIDLPKDSICRLGESPQTGKLNSTLILGSRFWTCQLHFRLRMGPMSLAEMERLLPGGKSFGRLRDWVRQYVGEEFFWDVQYLLAKQEVPVISLGKAGRLGWTTWLKTMPFASDAGDLILSPQNN